MMNCNGNYFPGCTENLGVVPLFLLSAFLCFPIFVAFLFLTERVCFVFDAMGITSSKSLIAGHRFSYFLFFVKIILLQGVVWGAEPDKTLIFSKGEQKIIHFESLSHYSLGNPEVISKKLSLPKKTLYLKGKKMGYTDLILWDKSKHKQHYHIYVLSKREALKMADLIQSIQFLPLEIQFQGTGVKVSGTLDRLEELEFFEKIKRDWKKPLWNAVNYTQKLQKQLISKIYLEFFQRKIQSYSCQLGQDQIFLCHYKSFSRLTDLEKLFSLKYGIQFNYHPLSISESNFRLSFKIVQVERHDGKEFSLGLYQLSGTIKSLINIGEISLIENNAVNALNQHFKFKTLAEPEITTNLNTPGKINLGMSHPYPQLQRSENIVQTDWKDTGLKIDYQLQNHSSDLKLKYSIELSSHSDGGIKQSREHAELSVERSSQFIPIFHTGLQQNQSSKEGIPLLSNIPILGHFFSYSRTTHNFKCIIGFVKVEHAP